MYNKVVEWLDSKMLFCTRKRKELKKQVDALNKQVSSLKDDNLELAMTNDYLLKEVNKYRDRFNEEHKEVLKLCKKIKEDE